ncbi:MULTISPECIES: valine--tRNA ligase [Gordonia]|uniref:Valine--tRNA ligase n=1 Tax=Gordonia sputi NBRC 100414 TaxID=1089453 RepID=H5TZD6_9ACTN|nr:MULTISPECIES: valine--tRNA ligase [Gordonia]NKY93994.1 valine--tRNA ligase [Gordonia sputi]OBA42228.1 valine--tRNA ligase [Gordonia sp. 852002-51296_SCH5728562-b]OBA65067.1 valine--tRNA ligase [Gordonia sp. 852002-10350_SCH5691597]GAB38844.1 valyl-tRNA synthetase [Gordonia sputi NBRC 100414]
MTDSTPALPKSWDPADHESKLYQGWVDAGYFTPDASSDKPAYSIVIPPPNVNGSLHMGHAYEHVLMDALTRRARMQGFETLWLPGMDHAAIAMQTMVERKLAAEGLTRDDLGRDAFIERVWQEKAEISGNIGEQMRRLGDGVDWTRERFTMDGGLSRAVQTVFKKMYDDGLIYQAERLVNWSPVLKTAVSDIEVSYADVEGELVSFRYGSLDDSEPHIVVATTRMETMLGDTAIAVHPDDERYAALVGTELEHPFLDRKIPVIADDYVDPEFGTGAVKITPAHDPNDFAVGARHDLPMPTIMDEEARIADTGTQFDGMDRFEARVKIREALAAQGRIVKEVRPYLHSVGHSERTGEPIEPRLSMQWWVAVESLAKAAGDAVRDGSTVIHPKSMEPRWFAWVDDMHDWCISRQLWWGHRIPIWYGPDGEVVCVGPDEQAPEGYVQETDVLDTWFSSGLWPFSTLGWPDDTPDFEKFYPNSVLVTGYDILFFWVARMMMFGTYVGKDFDADKKVPFHNLFLHGLVRDEHGRKMSKSRGNGIDPLDWVDRFGADALRFTLARSANPGSDISVGEDHAQSSRNFATKLYNATKFALMNGAQVPADGELPDAADLTVADRWILGRLDEVLAEVDAGFDSYEFSKACEALYHFAWDEVCDWYLELAKVQFAQDDPQRSRSTALVLGAVLDPLLRALSPVMPFVTEVLWKTLTGGESVVIASWPTRSGRPADAAAATEVDDLQRLITEVRRFRSDQGLRPGQRVAAEIDGLDAAGLSDVRPYLDSLARLDGAGDDFSATATVDVRLSSATVTVRIDTSGTVDIEAERKRAAKDLAAAEKELAQTTAKLGNEQFLAKAPDNVVAKIRERQQVATEEVERLGAKLASLGGS